MHPVVVYYRNDNDSISHKSFVFLSESIKHDAEFVFIVITQLINWLKSQFNHVNKITYCSDGCKSEYKNCKNLFNLSQHFSNFGIHAEWLFTATAHGKGPSDGVGATFKRLAIVESLRRLEFNQLLSSKDLFEFGQSMTTCKVIFISKDDHLTEQHDEKYLGIKTLPGTMSFHSFKPNDDSFIECRKYAQSNDVKKIKVRKSIKK